MEQTPHQIAKTPLEAARKEYHDATVEMTNVDAKLIDASASLEELRDAHGKSIQRVNLAREKLVEARSPVRPADETARAAPTPAVNDGGNRDHLIATIIERAKFIRDEPPVGAEWRDIWIRPNAREAVQLDDAGMWRPLPILTADLQTMMSSDELLQIRSDPRWQEG